MKAALKTIARGGSRVWASLPGLHQNIGESRVGMASLSLIQRREVSVKPSDISVNTKQSEVTALVIPQTPEQLSHSTKIMLSRIVGQRQVEAKENAANDIIRNCGNIMNLIEEGLSGKEVDKSVQFFKDILEGDNGKVLFLNRYLDTFVNTVRSILNDPKKGEVLKQKTIQGGMMKLDWHINENLKNISVNSDIYYYAAVASSKER